MKTPTDIQAVEIFHDAIRWFGWWSIPSPEVNNNRFKWEPDGEDDHRSFYICAYCWCEEPWRGLCRSNVPHAEFDLWPEYNEDFRNEGPIVQCTWYKHSGRGFEMLSDVTMDQALDVERLLIQVGTEGDQNPDFAGGRRERYRRIWQELQDGQSP
jgi:hypothetical protein